MILHWIWMILIGGVIGMLAKLVMPGKDGGGIVMTIVLGVAGSLLATYLGRFVGIAETGFVHFLAAIIGAVLLLVVYRIVRPMISKQSTTKTS